MYQKRFYLECISKSRSGCITLTPFFYSAAVHKKTEVRSTGNGLRNTVFLVLLDELFKKEEEKTGMKENSRPITCVCNIMVKYSFVGK